MDQCLELGEKAEMDYSWAPLGLPEAALTS